jgi:hypothetical protein
MGESGCFIEFHPGLSLKAIQMPNIKDLLNCINIDRLDKIKILKSFSIVEFYTTYLREYTQENKCKNRNVLARSRH